MHGSVKQHVQYFCKQLTEKIAVSKTAITLREYAQSYYTPIVFLRHMYPNRSSNFVEFLKKIQPLDRFKIHANTDNRQTNHYTSL